MSPPGALSLPDEHSTSEGGVASAAMIPALVLLLFSAGALEDDPRFVEAREMFERSAFDAALARFNLLLLSDELPDEERARVLLWKGAVEGELGRTSEAMDAFEDALLLDPDAKLPLQLSPKVLELLKAARQRAKEHDPEPPRVDTGEDGTVRPSGPGVLIKMTPSGRMEATAQERPPPPPLEEEAASLPFPWLLVGGGATVGLGALTLGAGGIAGTFALLDYTRAVEAPAAKEARLAEGQARAEALVANVLYGVGGAVVLAGATAALVGVIVGVGE